MNIYTIYLITNLINQKKYVGQTKQIPIKRFTQHLCSKNTLLSKAINKHGRNNFSFEVLYQTLDINKIDFLERYFIKEHNSFICETGHGYNLTTGGSLYKIVSDETKLKMSENHPNVSGVNNPNYGNLYSIETKQKLSELLIGNKRSLGYKHSMETKQKMSTILLGHTRCLGRIYSEETKQKMSDSHKNKTHSMETKQKMSDSRIMIKQQRVICPYCNKEGGQSLMTRYHFNNCKSFSTFK